MAVVVVGVELNAVAAQTSAITTQTPPQKKGKEEKTNFQPLFLETRNMAILHNGCVTQKYVNLSRRERKKKNTHTDREKDRKKSMLWQSEEEEEKVSDYAILPPFLLPRGNIA